MQIVILCNSEKASDIKIDVKINLTFYIQHLGIVDDGNLWNA